MKSVTDHNFSNIPAPQIPRSSFDRSHGFKTTFDAGYLVPCFLDEVLPGDTISLNPTMFARLNTPLYPVMDNMFLDVHFFFVPNRILWSNWRKFCGEQSTPSSSIDFEIPYIAATATTGYSIGSLYDYLGLPTGIPDYHHSALPLRAYQLIYSEWYRDQNLVTSGGSAPSTGDGPDSASSYGMRRRGKRHDYFTSCLPWLQKGDSVELPLGTSANVLGIGKLTDGYDSTLLTVYESGGSGTVSYASSSSTMAGTASSNDRFSVREDPDNPGYPGIYADLSTATAATINQLREAFQIQKLLERDARSGTRYAEIVKAHFGVQFNDVAYRPEFLGGSSTRINITSVPQTSESNTTPQGTLAGYGVAMLNNGGFTKSFTEHGYVMGIASVRADLTYQQGLHRMWSRSTRYDFYWPALAHIGEQAVLTQELYCQNPATDTGSTGTVDNQKVFGYQERWAEYRYKPSQITGKLRSTASGSLDAWHLSQEFTSLPSLNQTFIEENPPMERVVAVTTEPDFLMDCYYHYRCARPMPIYSVPGLIDHF